ncbi:MAG: hypothetical protein KC549_07915, partial [Myxococcales bacterium]|nr:hypothetical protein [Myxococcales bacterium]
MRVGALLAALLFAATAHARPRVAVLELRNPAGLTPAEVRFFGDVVRTAALRTLAERALVLTRENLAAQLPPGTDLSACEGACEVETGRNVGADFVVSGEILRLGGELRVLLKAHETRRGALVATERAAAASAAALEQPVEQVAGQLFGALRLQDAAPPVAAAGEGQRLDWSQTPELDFPQGFGGLQVISALRGKILTPPRAGTWSFELPWALPARFELLLFMGGDTRNERARCVLVELLGETPVPIQICPHPTDEWVLAFPDVGAEGMRRAAHDQVMPVRIRHEGGTLKLLLDDTVVIARPAPPTP